MRVTRRRGVSANRWKIKFEFLKSPMVALNFSRSRRFISFRAGAFRARVEQKSCIDSIFVVEIRKQLLVGITLRERVLWKTRNFPTQGNISMGRSPAGQRGFEMRAKAFEAL